MSAIGTAVLLARRAMPPCLETARLSMTHIDAHNTFRLDVRGIAFLDTRSPLQPRFPNLLSWIRHLNSGGIESKKSSIGSHLYLSCLCKIRLLGLEELIKQW